MKIICVGRNYVEHIKELNNEAPKDPVLFLKPDTSILLKKQPFFIPEFSNEVHHEVEILVKINRIGKHIDRKFAHKYYDEIGLGIDFTARDLQSKLKEKGLPWEKAKAFDGAAVVGKFLSKNDFSAYRHRRSADFISITLEDVELQSLDANIYDTAGRLLRNEKVNIGEQIRVVDLPKGIYYLKLDGGEKYYIGKFVKE